MTKKQYDVVIIGAGAAGCMAAIKAAERGKSILLCERNASLGKKILITGNGRCNLTNVAPMNTFIEKFAHSGKFLRTAFARLSNNDLIHFFTLKGLNFRTEDNGKIFPTTDKAKSIVSALEECLHERKVTIVYNTQIASLKKEDLLFIIRTQDNRCIKATKVIIATGGSAYPKTGSDGSGAMLAQSLGHTLIPFSLALVPLKTAEHWVKDLQGLSFQNICMTVHSCNRKITSEPGDILFTHFGLSGPLVIDLSSMILSKMKNDGNIKITINLVPKMTALELQDKLTQASTNQGKTQINNLINTFLPKRMTPLFLSLLNIKPEKILNQITKKERLAIIEALKAFPLTIVGSLSLDQAMATNGGIDIDDLHQKTMESKIVPGLFIAGEIIDGRGPSGGYNLQQAFSTGFLAGESAAESLVSTE